MGASAVVGVKAQVDGTQEIIKFKEALAQTKKEADGLARPVAQAGKSIDQVGKSTTKVTTQVRTMGERVQAAGSGMALAGSAAVGLWNAYDNVSDSAQRVSIAEGKLEGAENRLSKAREALVKLTQSGTASQLDLEQAHKNVVAAEANVERANLQLTNSQEALNESWLNAATSIIPNVFTGISGLTQTYNALRPSVDESIDSFLRQAAAMEDSGVSIIETSGNLTEYSVAATDAASASSSTASAISDVGATAADAATDVAQVGSNAAVAASNTAELGTEAARTATSLADIQRTAVDVSTDLAQIGSNSAVAATNVAEVGSEALNTGGSLATMSGTAIAAGQAAKTLADRKKELAKAATDATKSMGRAGLAGTLISVGGLIGKIVLIVGGAIAAFEIWRNNMFGFKDALAGFRAELDKLLGVSGETRDEWNKQEEGLSDWMDSTLRSIPGVKQFVELIEDLGGVSKDTSGDVGDMGGELELLDTELNTMSPLVQDLAKSWGLYGVEADKATEAQKRQIEALQYVESSLQPVRKSIIDLAVANGVDLRSAFAMTDDQLFEFALNLEELGGIAETEAERIAREAQVIADAWTASFERISAAQQEFAGSMRSAMGKMGQELGEEMEVGLSDLEKTVSKGLVGFSDQFFEEIFPEDFLAHAIIEGNDPEDIKKELKDLMHDVVDEDIVSKQEAKDMLKPMIDYFAQDLPGDVEEPLAYMAGQLPHMIEMWKPAIVNGVVAVGIEGKTAIKSHILDPMLEGLRGLETGASGIDFGRGFLNNITAALPAIEAEAGPKVAEMIQGLLDSKNLGVDEKVQGIIDILGQISPAWQEQIMQMDKDADGIADIMDNKILGPVDAMKLGILEAFQAIFEAIGNQEWAAALQEEIDSITGAVEGMSTDVSDIGHTVGAFGLDLTQTLEDVWKNGFEPVSKSADGTKILIKSLAEDGKQYMVDLRTGIATASDGSQTSLAALATGAGTANTNVKTAVDGMTGSFDGMRSKLAELIPTEAGTFGSLIYGRAPAGGAAAATGPQIPGPDLSLWDQAMQTFKPKWDQFWKDLLEGKDIEVDPTQSILAHVADHLGTWMEGIKPAWDNFWKTLLEGRDISVDASKSLLAQVSEQVGDWMTGIKPAWDNFWKSLLEGRDITIDTSSSLLSQVSTQIGDWMTGIKPAWDNFWKNLVAGRDVSIDSELSILSQVATQVGTWMNSMKEAWDNFWKGLVQGREAPEGATNLTVQEAVKNLFNIDPEPSAYHQQGYLIGASFTGGMHEGVTEPIPELDKAMNDIVGIFGVENWRDITEGIDSIFKHPNGSLWVTVNGVTKEIPPHLEGFMTAVGQILGTMDTSPMEQLMGSNGIIFTKATEWIEPLQGDYTQAMNDLQAILSKPLEGPKVSFTGPGGAAGTAQAAAGAGVGVNLGASVALPAGAGGAGGGTAPPPVPDFTEHIAKWTDYQTQIGVQINLIGQHILRLNTGYILMLTGVQTAAAQMLAVWQQHAIDVGLQVDATGLHFQRMILGYNMMAVGIHAGLEISNQHWTAHKDHVGLQVDATGLHIQRMVIGYNLLAAGAHAGLENSNQNWAAHADHVGSQVSAIGNQIGRLAREGYNALARIVHRSLEDSNQNWAAHVGHVRGMASSAATTVGNLATAVRQSMTRIGSAMDSAADKADNLRQAINRLQNKSITVTTTFVTKRVTATAEGFDGRVNEPRLFLAGEAGPEHVKVTPLKKRAAFGFSGVVNQPTRIFAGEGNRPELVQVTPLSGAGGRTTMNPAASSMVAGQRLGHVFQQPTIRAGGSSGKYVDRVVYFPDGSKAVYYANGNVKYGTFKPGVDPRGGFTIPVKSIKEKGIKGTQALTNRKPDREFTATGAARYVDPLKRRGGVTGRGGKSLFDLGVATEGPGGPRPWLINEQRYEDGSYARLYSDGVIVLGRDIYRPNTKYLKGKLKKGRSVKEVKYFANGKAEVTYYGDDSDDDPHKMKHNHPGPFDQGSGGKSKRYTTSTAEPLSTRAIDRRGINPHNPTRTPSIEAAKGWEGFVNTATSFLAGERGREYVNIQPAGKRGMHGIGAGRPIVIELHIQSTLDGKVVSETIRKELLGGIYSMT